MLRTHTCGELRMAHAGQKVTVCGWLQSSRDHKHFLFLVLRDRHGLIQVNVPGGSDLYETVRGYGREYVLRVTGEVKERESKNPNMPTGDIEIAPERIELLNAAEVPPFKIENETDGLEELRLKYRYLDIRRPKMAANLLLRARMMRAIREYLDGQGFCEIETPVLIKSTPEGARDFLVPSRLHPGNFYALPQSPQILKQLLMVAGMDRYYQIVKCFRDEDFRGDRQPEFTQVDCEMSFVTQEDILTTFEGLTQHVFRTVAGVELPRFQRLPYKEALLKYGTDKPDLRFGCEIQDVGAAVLAAEAAEMAAQADRAPFAPFTDALAQGGLVAGLNATGCAGFTRKQIDELTNFIKAPQRGGKGLVWIRFAEDGTVGSSAAKFYSESSLRAIGAAMGAQPGDLLLLMSDTIHRKLRKVLGDLRLELAGMANWRREGDWSVLWVVDFPLFERDEETGELTFAHHPFVMPDPAQHHLLDTQPEEVYAHCYDMVMNGNEILSGSVRIHRPDLQQQIFRILGLSEEEQQQKFGFLLEAFRYGAPPHAGCAFGFDRWVMLMAGEKNIREVMAFPKVGSGMDIMMDAPSPVPAKVMDELSLQLRPEKKD